MSIKTAVKAVVGLPPTLLEAMNEQAKRNEELERKYQNACLLRQDHEQARQSAKARFDAFEEAAEDNTPETAWQRRSLQSDLESAADYVKRDDEIIAKLDARRELGRKAYNVALKALAVETFTITLGKFFLGMKSAREIADELSKQFSENSRILDADLMQAIAIMAATYDSALVAYQRFITPAAPPKASGTMVRFLRSTLPEGGFYSIGQYSAGDTATFNNETVRQLVKDGLAEVI
jgi:hypothetical protein